MICRFSIHIGFTEKNQGVNQAMVTDILEDLYQEALHCQKEKGRVIRRQLDPSRSFRKKVRERNGTAGRGHPKARAQEAKHVHSHTMTKSRGKGTGDARQRTPSPPKLRLLAPFFSVHFTEVVNAERALRCPFHKSVKVTRRPFRKKAQSETM